MLVSPFQFDGAALRLESGPPALGEYDLTRAEA
jgi:hypothetical protein